MYICIYVILPYVYYIHHDDYFLEVLETRLHNNNNIKHRAAYNTAPVDTSTILILFSVATTGIQE